MNEWNRTLAFVAGAGVLAGAAWLTRPHGVREISLLSDQGKPLTPNLTDPGAVKNLEVLSFDEAGAKLRVFQVAFDGRRWVIPSENNYPADAEQRMGQAASAFVGLVKERVVTDNPAEHKRLGVVSPDDDKTAAPDGRGTRIVMRDGTGKVVADLILGAPVPATEGAPNKRYIRETGRNRVYVTSMQGAFSTKFTDWVQTDLFDMRPEAARNIRITRYRVDEASGSITEPSTITLDWKPETSPAATADGMTGSWSFIAEPGGPPAAGQVVSVVRVNEMLQTLSGLKLTGVRPKPANLAKALSSTTGEAALSVADQASLNLHGFYLGQKAGRLFGSEGELQIAASDGVVYSLWLGVVAGDGGRAAAGGQVGAKPGESAASEPGAAEARYVMITASFDPALVPEPKKPQELIEADAKAAAEKPASGDGATPPPAKPPEDAKITALRQQFQNDVDSWKQRSDAGKAKAERLGKRFADWYYLIDAKSLGKMRPTRDELLTIRTPAPAAGAAPAVPVVLPPALPPDTTPKP